MRIVNLTVEHESCDNRWEVTEEGKGMVERGSHEAVVWGLVGEGGMPQPDLFTAAGTFGSPLTLI